MIDAPKHYDERMRIFASETVTPGGIVLLGSSHLEWFDTSRFLPGVRFINRGIASDRLGLTERGILHRLDVSVFDCAPSMVVFNNGVNDLGELARTGEPSLDQIESCYSRVIAAIREGIPDTPLLIVNELPTTGRFREINPLIPRLNEHIARVALEHDCHHLDFHGVVADKTSELRADLTTDGLHLKDAGYAMFAESLKPWL